MSAMNTEIKSEFDNNFNTSLSSLCHTCLSSGRRLFPLGQFRTMFQQLMASDCNYYQIEDNKLYEEMLICWECVAHLHKTRSFLHKAKQTESILQFMRSNQVQIITSFSTLGHTIITDYYEPTHTPESPFEMQKLEDDNVKTDSINENIPTCKLVETHSLENSTKSDRSKKPPQNQERWYKSRRFETKKPKFKLVEIKPNDRYKKVQITQEQLVVLLEEAKSESLYVNVQYKCNKCVLGFNSEKSYVTHMDTRHKEELGRYVCDICETRMPTKQMLSRHCRSHYYGYSCTLCPYWSFRSKNLLHHWHYRHKNEIQCLKCGITFWSRKDFFEHHKEKHERFECDHCGITFKMKYCIKKHIRKKHSPLQCKLCDKRFSRYSGLWVHNRLKHSTLKMEPGYCVECNKHYDSVYSYKWHLNNSVRHRPKKKVSIPCPSCEKVFSKKIYMKDHYDLVHLKNFKYRCEQCDKNFIRNADLVKHTRRVHEGITTPKNKMCYVCGRGFTSNKILENHIRTHTGERPFQCPHCPAKFAQKVALTGHQRNVHGKHQRLLRCDSPQGYG